MGDDETRVDKKKQKTEAKAAKKMAKAEVDLARASTQVPESPPPEQPPQDKDPSVGVRFAESVRGLLYIILAVSLVVALIIGETDAVVTLEDIISNLAVLTIGKIILAIVALALLIYGLKNMRVVK
jgi:uncharacterized membrane protein YdbT with pleckstrin-like domain